LRSTGNKIGIAFNIESRNPPLPVGGTGFVVWGGGLESTYYYSLTRLDIEGTLRVVDREYEVSGIGWMDHQWGNFAGAVGGQFWEWFSIQLENNVELNLIATRRVGKFELKIWQVMTAGAVIVILTQSISFGDAFYAIDFDVMLFLFSMFVIGSALEYGGLMDDFIKSISSKIRNPHIVLFFVIFVMSLSSALLMNDTIAVIGTPIVLRIAKKYNLPKKILLLSLAFSVT
jgi:hypothetical protein